MSFEHFTVRKMTTTNLADFADDILNTCCYNLRITAAAMFLGRARVIQSLYVAREALATHTTAVRSFCAVRSMVHDQLPLGVCSVCAQRATEKPDVNLMLRPQMQL